ncbi:hypothetical protein CEE37_10540 [candidate division LCP-89 bacterium B3_LCP]|uniref:Uncharacterized protein n=1 Tax=candidate division LCP-89 bacterium B3_LCP TaxID=2012998 RepID=A0A532UXN0_UNCL8|nr:MAG: hypothetical protein CEE37_10540 [candidate division LCP-89 bacterium B3_LCP]
MKTDRPNKSEESKSQYTWPVIAVLSVLPPLLFWLTIKSGFSGGIDLIFRFWQYLPDFLLNVIIVLLPIPPLLLGVYSLWQIWKRKAKGIYFGLLSIIASVLLIIFCTMTIIR